MSKLWTIALAVPLLFGCGESSTPVKQYNVNISFDVTLRNIRGISNKRSQVLPENPCTNRNTFEDISRTTRIVVANGEGKTLAVTTFDDDGEVISDSRCRYRASLSVPGDEPFYNISIGRRGSTTYSNAEWANNPTLSFNLGD